MANYLIVQGEDFSGIFKKAASQFSMNNQDTLSVLVSDEEKIGEVYRALVDSNPILFYGEIIAIATPRGWVTISEQTGNSFITVLDNGMTQLQFVALMRSQEKGAKLELYYGCSNSEGLTPVLLF
jgi:hypothetical protein